MVRETTLLPDNFIYPLFVTHGKGVKKEISSMPGNFQQSIDNLVKDCEEVYGLGIPAVILFGIPRRRTNWGPRRTPTRGSSSMRSRPSRTSCRPHGNHRRLHVRVYQHGHCGVIKNGIVQNDETLALLAKEALSHAKAGADMVAPSDMMDGRVAAIRDILDDEGFENIPIMSYAAKYASGFYGPFAKRRNPHPSSAIGVRTRWTRRIAARHCARSS